MTQQATSQNQPDSPELRAQIKDNLVKSEIVSQEAVKVGLDKNPEITQQLDMIKQQLLVRAYVSDYVKKNPIKDETHKAEYEKVRAAQGDKEVKVQHILVEDEKEAKDLLIMLNIQCLHVRHLISITLV